MASDKKAAKRGKAPVETDDFGLPIRTYTEHKTDDDASDEDGDEGKWADAPEGTTAGQNDKDKTTSHSPKPEVSGAAAEKVTDDKDGLQTKDEKAPVQEATEDAPTPVQTPRPEDPKTPKLQSSADGPETPTVETPPKPQDNATSDTKEKPEDEKTTHNEEKPPTETPKESTTATEGSTAPRKQGHGHQQSIASLSSVTGEGGLSEFSHQQLSMQPEETPEDPDGGWQTMPAFARYDMYDDDDKLIARERNSDDEDENFAYGGLGGAGKGYTRVQMDEDAQSANSMDDNTQYLFKEGAKGTAMIDEDDDDARDAVSQMQATKDLLTEGQRIAYVGVVRLEIANMVNEGEQLESTRKIKKEVAMSVESTKMWGQKMMIRLYAHMDISEAEQVMIEQLAEHGVQPADLVPALHANARVKNPMAGRTSVDTDGAGIPSSPAPDAEKEALSDEKTPSDEKAPKSPSGSEGEKSPKLDAPPGDEKFSKSPVSPEEEEPAEPPPPYEAHEGDEVPDVQTPSQMPSTDKIDIDLRWTVLCDIFLILIADSVYDARSRVLIERVGKSLDISWTDICRFEKRVTDALEMQQAAEKENWNEDEHLESRRKRALKKRYMMLGLATVGGGLVIGLSAGLLAPVIGAGLAAGFSTIGVAGTSSFLGGVGGAAVITSGAAASGGFIGAKAANRRTGAVKTFEYRPLHNNKRVNLIVTISGWLTGKVDDVRLPFSTVDSTMGDIYSVLWEPEMLRSTGDTVRILATEALTQSIQQILGSTILAALMGALQLPIVLTKLAYLIDNPWAVSLDRATAAGKILADSLIERNLGTRPITLVGYSLGSRVIFSCLQELAKRGAYGLIQNVYLFGSPVVYKKEEYLRARTVVPGRFVNGYNRTDWILGYLFRLTNGGIRRVAGLAAIEELPWIENLDVTDLVKGHMEYRTMMPKLLMECGWMVESEEFTEIEDPDPDNHEQRQRQLISEIEEAREKLEKEGREREAQGGKQSKFSLFGRRKKMEKQEWELYEDKDKDGKDKDGAGKEGGKDAKARKESDDRDRDAQYRGALFDVDAIRAELAKEAAQSRSEDEIQIREIESTLPPMKLDISAAPSLSATSTPTALNTHHFNNSSSNSPIGTYPHGSLRETRSADHVPQYHNPEDEIQMTFDTSFDDHRGSASKHDEERDGSRPGLKSNHTLPDVSTSNPWGDPDDDDFGQEKEISMTFA